MPPKDDTLYLGHMLDTARWVENRVARVDRAEFDRDEDLQLALTRQLQIIGEAAWRVSEPTRNRIPQIPWPKVATMRHKLVHDYFDVRLDIVWDTAKHDMAPLIAALLTVIPENPPE